ncbi:hypothetical protein U9R90_03750 [Streptomyces sp. E11-3]|uniref:hypothetical protein n=1 Tax=Streptomyces sp. E11-3 TaxID=3110112 RepID=UPI0039816C4B
MLHRKSDLRMASCDDWLPRYHWRTHHDRAVRAEPAAAARAVREVRAGDTYILRPLVLVRGIPARLRSRDREWYPTKEERILDGLRDGVGAFPLQDDPGGDLVVGFVGQPWKLRQQWLALTPDEYREFDQPGYMKGVMAFSASGRGERTLLHTETRIYGTDQASVRRFRPYWLLIEPFSGLIRHDWLAAAARNARSSARP